MHPRIFHQISENLEDRAYVDVFHAKDLEEMFNYKSENLEQDILEAINLLVLEEGSKKFKPKDFDGFVPLHTETKRDYFEELFGLKSTLYDIQVSKRFWKKFCKRMHLDSWEGGMLYHASYFENFNHPHFHFNKFGFAIESPDVPVVYNHEALHAARGIYARNYHALAEWEDRKYASPEIKAKLEYSLLDELLAYMATNLSRDFTLSNLKVFYLPELAKYTYLAAEYTNKEKCSRLSKYVKKKLKKVVDTAYWLNENLSLDIITPLFLSIGPTVDEIKKKRFYSPFNDVINLGKNFDDRKLDFGQVEEKIVEKGYGY